MLIVILYSDLGRPIPDSKKVEDFFDEAERNEDVESMAIVGTGLCISCDAEGKYRKVEEIASRVIRLLEETQTLGAFFLPHCNSYVYYRSMYGHALGALGRFEEARSSCERGLFWGRKINHLFSVGVAEIHFAGVCTLKGDGEGALNHSQSCMDCRSKAASH